MSKYFSFPNIGNLFQTNKFVNFNIKSRKDFKNKDREFSVCKMQTAAKSEKLQNALIKGALGEHRLMQVLRCVAAAECTRKSFHQNIKKLSLSYVLP